MLLLPSCSVHSRLSSRHLLQNISIATVTLHDVCHGFDKLPFTVLEIYRWRVIDNRVPG